MSENTNIHLSDKLKNLLSKFKKTSNIAYTLSKEKIEMSSLVDNHIDYLSISEEDPTKISYLTKDRIELIKTRNECLWTSPKRFHCKPGSFVLKIFKNASPKDIELFSNQFKSFVSKQEFKFEIVNGESIRKYYGHETYSSQSGSLGASCMKAERCQKYLEIYCKNPNVVKMLIMKNNNDLILGRAILWEFHWENQNYKIMDRIYTSKDEDLSIFFKNWATENGYLYKKHQNWANTFQFEGSDSEIMAGIKLENIQFSYYPYMDTFKWIDLENQIVYNHKPEYFTKNNQNHRLACGPEGLTESPDYLSFDEISRNWGYKLDIIEVDGIMTSSNNCVWSETLDRYILKRDSVWNDELRDNIYADRSRMDIKLISKRLDLLNRSKPDWFKTYGLKKELYSDLYWLPNEAI